MNDMTIGTIIATPPAAAAEAWLAAFNDALASSDADAAARLFAATSFWRDLISFTWNIKTMENQDGVRDMLRATLPTLGDVRFSLAEEPVQSNGVVEAWLHFETASGRGEGHLRLRDGLAWTLLTTLTEIKGFEEPLGERRPKGAEHGISRNRKSWTETRAEEARALGRETQPYVLIIGGGQGGIALGARLRQMGVSHLVIDKHDRPGDQWRKRYKSLCLHDPVWYDHLPYLDFPRNWPVFSPKDKVGDWLEMYTKVMEVNYWVKTEATHAAFDPTSKTWCVTVTRDGVVSELRPTQLVLATGMSGKPNIPKFKGMERFRGDQQHSSQHPGPDLRG